MCLAVPCLFVFGSLGSLGIDAITELRIRHSLSRANPNPGIDALEKLVGHIDGVTYGRLLELSPGQRANLGVKIWEERRSTRVYE